MRLLLQGFLLGVGRIGRYNVATVVQAASFLLATAVAVAGLSGGVTGALVAFALAWTTADVLLFVWTRRISGGFSWRAGIEYLRRAVAYGAKLQLGSVVWLLNLRLDAILVNGFLNPTAVGYYAVAVQLAQRLWLLSQAAYTVLFPRVASQEPAESRRLTALVSRTVLLLTVVAAATLAQYGHKVVLYEREKVAGGALRCPGCHQLIPGLPLT